MLTLLLALSAAQAFGLDSHRTLTERSVELAAATAPSVASYESVLVNASLYEDLDLVTKWGRYSHYYDPEHTLVGMRRLTSRDRIEGLGDQLDLAVAKGDDGGAWWVAGRLLHHVQDMASPPHVVPVPHNTTDGFESFDVDEMVSTAGRRRVAPMSGPDAHEALARETKMIVEDGGWDVYWVGRPGRFGAYGAAGNTFARSDDADRERKARALLIDRTEAAVAYGRAFLVDTAQRLQTRDRPQVAAMDSEPAIGQGTR